MATQLINIIVNSKGFVTVQKELQSVGDAAKQTTTYLNSLRAIFAAAIAFSGAGAIVEVVDGFTQLQNRLKLVSNGANEVSTSWERLMGIANASYSTIDSTVNLYYRVAQAYKAWGESAEDAYEFTNLFQKSAILSGSTMQTTAQAVYQFSQALNKGKLDGDEFRSVLEGLPYVANIIQKELGVTRSELYALSADGKISLDKLKAAFENAAKQIESDFAGITPTIGMALIVLQNKWVDFIGKIQTSTGVFSLIAQAILLIANNFNILALILTPVAAAFVYMAGKLGVGLLVIAFTDLSLALRTTVIPAFTTLWAVIAANPLFIIPALIAAVVAAVIYFRAELGISEEAMKALGNAAKTVFGSIATIVEASINIATAIIKSFIEGVRVLLSDASDGWIEMGKIAIQFAKDVYEGWIKIGDIIEKLGNYLITNFKQAWQDVCTSIMSYIGPIIEAIKRWINYVKQLISLLSKALTLGASVGSEGGGGGSVGANYGFQGYAGEFNSGGGFKVGGTGTGRDTTAVSFRANRGERVTVETKKQQRQNNNNTMTAANVNVPVSIVNVIDPKLVINSMESSSGQRTIINSIASNRDEIQQILGVR